MSNRIVVVVTKPEFNKAKDVFASHPRIRCVRADESEEDLAAVIRETGAHAAIVGPVTYHDALYTALLPGGVIARFGVGHDGIDQLKATRAGLLCTNTPSVLNQSVAEFTMSLILAAANHIPVVANEVKNGIWQPRLGMEIRNKTLAIIGCGGIGQRVAQIATEGFHMNVIRVGRADDFRAALRDADFVSLHMSATPDNKHFINHERLAMLRQHAWLINTARGMIVDEAALFDALAGRPIAGAALDVFEREPYEPVDPSRDLRTLPNVILTPHRASSTVEASHAIAERALRNVLLADAGNFAEMDLLNPEVLRRI